MQGLDRSTKGFPGGEAVEYERGIRPGSYESIVRLRTGSATTTQTEKRGQIDAYGTGVNLIRIF